MMTLRIGIVGFGFMGRMHCRCWQEHPGAQVVAIADSEPDRVSQADIEGGNLAGAAPAIDPDRVAVYSNLQKMIDDQSLDAISVTLPTWLHADASIAALQAGLHVLCEKPMALDEAACREMMRVAQESGRMLQIAHCIRFWPAYARCRELIQEGNYGSVVAAEFRRLGSMPGWSADNWLAQERRSGGIALDLHIHDADFIQYLWGMPQAVKSRARTFDNGSMGQIMTEYDYGDGVPITAEGSWMMPPAFGFEMSFRIHLQNAVIQYDNTRDPDFVIWTEQEESALIPQLPDGDGYAHQIDHFVRKINGEQMPEVTTLKSSLDSVRLVKAEMESVRSGRAVEIDTMAESVGRSDHDS